MGDSLHCCTGRVGCRESAPSTFIPCLYFGRDYSRLGQAEWSHPERGHGDQAVEVVTCSLEAAIAGRCVLNEGASRVRDQDLVGVDGRVVRCRRSPLHLHVDRRQRGRGCGWYIRRLRCESREHWRDRARSVLVHGGDSVLVGVAASQPGGSRACAARGGERSPRTGALVPLQRVGGDGYVLASSCHASSGCPSHDDLH